MSHKLTREEWEALCLLVYERDLRQRWLAAGGNPNLPVPYAHRSIPMCVAPLLDPQLSGTCSGRSTFDHVPCQTTMGKKAPDDARHLQTVCEWHHGTNRTGGGWATSKVARGLSRDYLRILYPDHWTCALP